jgi:hypothetical protein
MTDPNEAVNLDAVLHRYRAKRTDEKEAESRLDSLLDLAVQPGHESGAVPPAPASALESLRRLFQDELVPAGQELAAKYRTRGILLTLDARRFLDGGRELTMSFEFKGEGLRLDGVVTPVAIAFSQTRYTTDDPAGITASGPTLRTRGLHVDAFREFLCQQIGSLVQAVMARQGRTTPSDRRAAPPRR